jgi:hypothetical protein
VLQFALDEAGVDLVGAHIGMRDQRRKEGDVGDDAPHVKIFERPIESIDGCAAGGRPGDDLCQHGIVMRRHGIAVAIAGIDPQAV